MNVNKKFIIYLLVSAAASSTAFFFFPAAKADGVTAALAVAFATTLTQLGALWYFISAMGAIKRGLKIAYILLSIGIFFFSLLQLIPSLTIIPGFAAAFANPALGLTIYLTPYAFGTLFMFLGMRKFARLLQVRYLWTSLWLVLGLALVSAIIFAVVPHTTPADTLPPLIIGLVAWCGMLGVAATLVAVRIREAIGVIYKPSIVWVAAALAAVSFTTFHEVITKAYFVESPYAVKSFSLWPFLITGVLLLRAGMSFKETEHRSIQLPANASHVDIVIATAQRVSNPAAVNEKLNEVRSITAQVGGSTNESLSSSDRQRLVKVYLHLEKYLTTEEPLYKFTQEGLRGNLPEEFLKDLSVAGGATSSPAAA